MFNIAIIPRHIRSTSINMICKATNSRVIHLDSEMKKLNDRKEFAKVIALFDKHKHEQIPTDRSIVQVLKACAQLRDVKYGVKIHKELSNHSLKDVYIQSTLIHFYSKFVDSSLQELILFD